MLLLVLTAACSSDKPSEPQASPTAAGHVITGTFALAHEGTGNGWTYDRQGLNDGPKLGDVCWGEGGHSDIAEGADVTVTGGSGDILALGALGPGTLEEAFAGGSDWDQYGPFGLACVFEFEVRQRPGQRLLRDRGVAPRRAPLQPGRARSVGLVGGVLPRGGMTSP